MDRFCGCRTKTQNCVSSADKPKPEEKLKVQNCTFSASQDNEPAPEPEPGDAPPVDEVSRFYEQYSELLSENDRTNERYQWVTDR